MPGANLELPCWGGGKIRNQQRIFRVNAKHSAGQAYALDPMQSPPLASLDPTEAHFISIPTLRRLRLGTVFDAIGREC